MRKLAIIYGLWMLTAGCDSDRRPTTVRENAGEEWSVAIIPASVRIDPLNGKVIENRFKAVKNIRPKNEDLQARNWIYDGKKAMLYSARGEYISFQVTVNNYSDSTLKNINISMSPF